MEMEILLRNKVYQEIVVNSTTEFKKNLDIPLNVLNEGTPKTAKT